nr:MAG TPA: hypothetical protein [Caudoviricetes sp.]
MCICAKKRNPAYNNILFFIFFKAVNIPLFILEKKSCNRAK